MSKSDTSGFDRALVVAAYFGFMPIETPKIIPKDTEMTHDCLHTLQFDAAERAAFIRHYLERNLAVHAHPLAVAYRRNIPKKKLRGYTLHFVGSTGGIGEAILIRTALSILKEEGYKNLFVDLNCVGDKESIGTYERELMNFVRKLGTSLNPELREILREDIFNIFRAEGEHAKHLRENMPQSIAYLSTQSRNYFKDVLEYIEALGIEFRLMPALVGDRHHSSHTIFAIRSDDSKGQDILATGYSYSRLGKRFGLKKEVPMVGVNLFMDEESGTKKVYKELPKPKFYLVQIGREAKMKSLSLIELLRTHRIPVHHFLGKDKLTAQMSSAENLRVSHLIILGQKEALENTATIRNVVTRAQDTISIADLPLFLKKVPL